MSKQDNLHDFLVDIADAVREKKGTNEKINAQNLSSEIRSIESGGGLPQAEWNDVNFFDYDGTIRYSYSWDDFMELTELPPLPQREGLVYEDWGGWTLDELKSQENRRMDVAAYCVTADGCSHFHITMLRDGEFGFTLETTDANSVAIDWGDGVFITYSYTSVFNAKKNLTKGTYCVKVKSLTSNIVKFGNGSTPCVIGDCVLYDKILLNNCVLADYCFNKVLVHVITSEKSIRLPPSFNVENCAEVFRARRGTSSANNNRQGSSPKYAVIGKFQSMSNAEFNGAQITDIVINNSISSLGYNAFSGSQLISVYIPDKIVTINGSAFSGCKLLKNIRLSRNLTTLGSNVFNTCSSLTQIDIPKEVMTIKAQIFGSCSSLKRVGFLEHTEVPVLENVNAFTGNPADMKIVVPDAIYDDWIAATNWSSFASKIVKASEYVEPTNE